MLRIDQDRVTDQSISALPNAALIYGLFALSTAANVALGATLYLAWPW
jgi:hypothetical protein